MQLTRLQELDMGWNIRLRDEALECLPPSLTKIDLSFCGGLSNAALEHLAALPALASCSLRKCGGVTDAVRSAVLLFTSLLLTGWLAGLAPPSPANLPMTSHCFQPPPHPILPRISCPPCPMQGMRQLARCSSLRHLDLSYTTLSAAGLLALAALPGLASLVLVDCLRLVQPPSMKILVELLPALHTLDLSNNRRLDDGCMQVGGRPCGCAPRCYVGAVARYGGSGGWGRSPVVPAA